MADDFANLIDLVRTQSSRIADRVLYRCLPDDNDIPTEITYAHLEQKAKAVAAELLARLQPGDRVLILSPVDLDSIVAFFGCVFAGMVAVPVPPPRPLRPCSRIRAIIAEARPSLVLAPAGLWKDRDARYATNTELMALPWLNVSEAAAGSGEGWSDPAPGRDHLAFLQFTSGSTAHPKGVMVSHGNLLANSAMIYRGFRNSPGVTGVMWLPFYHDMGLIGGVLQTLYTSGTNTFISPSSFIQKPLRWLELLSRTKARIGGGPCFAFDHCVRKTTPEQRASLDLSHWELAFTGAEMIHAETLERFAEAFAVSGFKREALYPCYGLAEATLIVSGGQRPQPPRVLHVDPAGLRRREVISTPGGKAIVGCGMSFTGESIAIVDPATGERCDGNRIGEIWVAGANIARGYWNNPVATEAGFAGKLPGDDRAYLKTGDLGFLDDNELYVVGRVKDLIIIRGRNYYPTDIEQTVEASHPLVRAASTAAFAIEADGIEQLAIAVEVERGFREAMADDLIVAVRQAVADQHEVEISTIALLKPGALPRTSSGKIQRSLTRDQYLADELATITCWNTVAAAEEVIAPDDAGPELLTSAAIQEWLMERIAHRLSMPIRSLNVHAPLMSLGLSSKDTVVLAGQLETKLARPVPVTLIFEFPTIAALAKHLSGEAVAVVADGKPKRERADVTGLSDSQLNELVQRELARLRVLAGESAEASHLSPLQQLALAVSDARQRIEEVQRSESEPIAIVGMGCRFPGNVDTPDKFWKLLIDGVDAIGEVPPERWDVDQFFDAEPGMPGKANTRWGGFLPDVDRFEPEFFGVSPREASFIDPQQRLLLEVAWDALEDAGIPPTSLAGTNTGVFVGAIGVDWVYLLGKDLDNINAHLGPGAAHSILANRISYLFDFHGPSMALDTACSSSLVTVHLACKALRERESDVCLAGGVNLILSPEMTIALSQARMMSPTGRCHTFDASADGYVRGEGCGLVVLKRLSDAVAHGDRIVAIIRGSATNQDGRSNGLVAPSKPAQEAVIRTALAEAKLTPLDIDYVEAHGTGTSIGDPIEVAALVSTLTPNRDPAKPLIVGSVKTNIGHLESAAGIAGLMKTILALRHRQIPKHLHLQTVNPLLEIKDAAIAFPRETTPWPEGPLPRFAGVSSFGFGGTNAHLVIEGPGEVPAVTIANDRPRHVLALSARTPESLRVLADRYAELPDVSLADLAYSANTGRTHREHRLAVSAKDTAEAKAMLNAFVAGNEAPGLHTHQAQTQAPGVVFLMTGQGAQYAGMGQTLYRTQPVFRTAIDQCDQWLRPYRKHSLLSVLFPRDGDNEGLIDQTEYTQPALFALQYALCELWKSWGVVPTAVMGHSVGEFAAACAAGVVSAQDGLRFVAERGRLMQALPAGGIMTAVFTDEAHLRTLLHADVSIAAFNGPTSIVISGPEAAVETTVAKLTAAKIKTQRLVTSHAFHSALLDPMLDGLERAAGTVQFNAPHIDLISNLTAQPAGPDLLADPGYWRMHARRPVQFTKSVQHLVDKGQTIFLEIGPNPTLLGMARRCLTNDTCHWLPSLRKNGDDWESILDSVARLFTLGVAIDWHAFDRGHVRHRLPLPNYPFQRQSYWVGDMGHLPGLSAKSGAAMSGPILHPLLGYRIETPLAESIFENRVTPTRPEILSQHRAASTTVVPCAVFLETALAAAKQLGDAFTVDDFALHEPLALRDKAQRALQTIIAQADNGRSAFKIVSRTSDGAWVTHAAGHLIEAPTGEETRAFAGEQSPIVVQGRELPHKIFDRARDRAGIVFGHSFLTNDNVWSHGDEAVAKVKPGIAAGDYRVHPGILENGILLLEAAHPHGEAMLHRHLLSGIGSVRIHDREHAIAWVHAVTHEAAGHRLRGDVFFHAADGQLLVELRDVRLRQVPRDWLPRLAAGPAPQWVHELAWASSPLAASPKVLHGRYLIIDDSQGIGSNLSRKLSAIGATCSVIKHNEPVIERLKSWIAGGTCDAIIATTACGIALPADIIENCGRILDITQTLASRTGMKPPRLWLVTRGAQHVIEDDRTVPAQGPLWGLARTLAVEMSELNCARIDLGANDGVDQLVAEIAANGKETQVALRGTDRFVARLRRVDDLPSTPAAIHADRTYLITGGLGGLGLLIARWLVNRGAKHLVLTGRRLPSDDAAALIAEMEADGARVTPMQADIASAADVESVFTQLDAGFPPLAGVFHAAGVLDDGIIVQQSRERFARVMGAKVDGTWQLHQHTLNRPLDYFVLFSSAASLLGSPGQANYAAANAFMDSVAHARHEMGLPALSINWGGWAEVGMAAELDKREGRRHDAGGVGRIDPLHGLITLEQLLAQSRPQAGVLPIDWATFFEQFPAGMEPTWLADLSQFRHAKGNDGPPELVKKLEEVPADEKRAAVLAFVQQKAAHVLRVAAGTLPDPRRTLNELGVDSLMGVELCNAVGRGVGRHLAPTILFNYPTLEALANHMASDILGLASAEPVRESITPAVDEAREQALAEVESLTEEEINAMLAGEFSNRL